MNPRGRLRLRRRSNLVSKLIVQMDISGQYHFFLTLILAFLCRNLQIKHGIYIYMAWDIYLYGMGYIFISRHGARHGIYIYIRRRDIY